MRTRERGRGERVCEEKEGFQKNRKGEMGGRKRLRERKREREREKRRRERERKREREKERKKE